MQNNISKKYNANYDDINSFWFFRKFLGLR